MNATACTLLTAAFMVLAACATGAHEPTPAERLVDTDWRVESINEQPVAIPNPVTLSFNEGRASGRGGCNQYSGMVDFDDSHITFKALISTRMACTGPGIMQTEVAYFAALQAAQGYVIGATGKLTIRGGTASVQFTPQPRQNRP